LKAQGGGVISFTKFSAITEIPDNAEDEFGIRYDQEGPSGWCNNEGLIAYANTKCLSELFSILQQEK
jgi:hypothetical protein